MAALHGQLAHQRRVGRSALLGTLEGKRVDAHSETRSLTYSPIGFAEESLCRRQMNHLVTGGAFGALSNVGIGNEPPACQTGVTAWFHQARP